MSLRDPESPFLSSVTLLFLTTPLDGLVKETISQILLEKYKYNITSQSSLKCLMKVKCQRIHLKRKENEFFLGDALKSSQWWKNYRLLIFSLATIRQAVDSTFSELQRSFIALPLKDSLPHCDNSYMRFCN